MTKGCHAADALWNLKSMLLPLGISTPDSIIPKLGGVINVIYFAPLFENPLLSCF